jgi:transcriptional regulator with XRE-family HTH domain
MKDRIAHIMRAKNLKASDFAAMLGIQPSAVSHILAGRNKPSLEIVKKIKETFPEYNLDWIILGSGPMTTSEPFKESVQEPSFDFTPLPDDNPSENSVIPQDVPQNDALVESGIKSMVILYDDGTFETFSPR